MSDIWETVVEITGVILVLILIAIKFLISLVLGILFIALLASPFILIGFIVWRIT